MSASNLRLVDAAAVADDTQRIFNEVSRKAEKLVPQIIAQYAETGAPQTMTIKVKINMNKDDETVILVTGSGTLTDEAVEMTGEILNKNLRLF